MRLGIVGSARIHNFPEGIATFVSAMSGTKVGLSITVAVAIHNIPEGIAVAVPIYYATKAKVKDVPLLLSGLAEPLGAVVDFSSVIPVP